MLKIMKKFFFIIEQVACIINNLSSEAYQGFIWPIVGYFGGMSIFCIIYPQGSYDLCLVHLECGSESLIIWNADSCTGLNGGGVMFGRLWRSLLQRLLEDQKLPPLSESLAWCR
jgi:hypothetical protein